MQPQFPTQNTVPSTDFIIFGNNLKNRLKNSFTKRSVFNNPQKSTQAKHNIKSRSRAQYRVRSKSFSEGIPVSKLERHQTNTTPNSQPKDHTLVGNKLDLLSNKNNTQISSEKINQINLTKLRPPRNKLPKPHSTIPRQAPSLSSTQRPSNKPRYIGDIRKHQQHQSSRARHIPQRPSEYNRTLEKYMLYEINGLHQSRQRNSDNILDYIDFKFPSLPINFFNLNSNKQKHTIQQDNFEQQKHTFYYPNQPNFHSKQDFTNQEYANRSQNKKSLSDFIFPNLTRKIQQHQHQSPIKHPEKKKKYIMKNFKSEDFFRLDPVEKNTHQPSRQAQHPSTIYIDHRPQPRSSGSRHPLTPKYNSIQMVNNMPTDPLERQRENEHLERQLLLRHERRKRESAWFGRKLWNSIFD